MCSEVAIKRVKVLAVWSSEEADPLSSTAVLSTKCGEKDSFLLHLKTMLTVQVLDSKRVVVSTKAFLTVGIQL